MAYIGHPCGCRHSDLVHSVSPTTSRRSCNSNPCGRRCHRQEQPELLPTFDIKGRPIDRIVPPGEGLALMSGGTATPKTCNCDACQALYAELAGAAAA